MQVFLVSESDKQSLVLVDKEDSSNAIEFGSIVGLKRIRETIAAANAQKLTKVTKGENSICLQRTTSGQR